MRINMCQLQHMTPCNIIHMNNEGDYICVLFVFLDCASTLNNPVNPVRVSSLLEMTFTDINLSPPSIQIKKKIKLIKVILLLAESSIPTAFTKTIANKTLGNIYYMKSSIGEGPVY